MFTSLLCLAPHLLGKEGKDEEAKDPSEKLSRNLREVRRKIELSKGIHAGGDSRVDVTAKELRKKLASEPNSSWNRMSRQQGWQGWSIEHTKQPPHLVCNNNSSSVEDVDGKRGLPEPGTGREGQPNHCNRALRV